MIYHDPDDIPDKKNMPQYAVIQSHPPDNCPMTTKSVRDFVSKQFPKNQELANKLGVKVREELHLDPDHKAFILFDAPNAEAVRDYLVQGGYIHFSNLSFYLVTPIAELLKQLDQMPTIY
jgi:hypothetical protein